MTPDTSLGQSVDETLNGYVYMEFSFDAEVDIKKATQSWSEERIARLAAGDEEAISDLVSNAIFEATGYEGAEPDRVTVTIGDVETEVPR